ncbi:putative permease [cyanobacterium endosymbiont of Rhopalodia gibberula]|uniref:AI-2E family transporter n=1 Tax=cyanobacterium endosymbiont of Rhopalodia gibberula TaxID=1763363 RepID=UPI000DC6F913|nr:AI-2E family transporter [cyanobacterium endosymbiont of Rhopalodia gibberula]BBA78912.1 putative permease [cyanobacterium endosymbiont of Rhopalodia gibberula]
MNFSQWLGFIVIAIALHILWQIRQLLSLFFAAVVIANGLNHLVKWFQEKGIRRSYGVLLSTGILIATIVGFFWVIVPPFINQFPELIQLVSQGIEQLIVSLRKFISELDPEWIPNFPNTQELTQQLRPLVSQIAGQGLSVFYNTLAIPLSSLLLLALTLMLLTNPQPYRQGFIRLFPSFYRKKIDSILCQCDEALQGWLIGVLFDILVIALLSFLGLLILGIPLALSQAMLAGILAFIPNIGFVLSVVPPVAIALLESPWKSIIVIILYVSIYQIQIHFLNSLVIRRKASLLPAFILLSQLFFTIIFGILGFFLALPLAVVSKVWVQEILVTDILDVWQDKS